MESNSVFDKFGGRKAVMGFLGLIILTALAVTKPTAITTEFITGILGIIGLFNVSNVTTTLKSFSSGDPSTPPTTEQPIPPPVVNFNNDVPDYVKTELLNYQNQINETNQRLETMADIIQKSLLTKPIPQATMNLGTQEMIGVYDAQQSAVPNTAEGNRAAISQFLNSYPGQGRG